MFSHDSSGEVALRPSVTGLAFVIEADRTLTFAPSPKKYSLLTRLSVALVMSFGLWALPLTSSAASYTSADIIAGTNAVRQQQGVPPLVVNQLLERAALAKAQDMFTHQYFDHVSPDGQSPWQWYTGAGYQFTTAGENLAIDFIDGQAIIPAWMTSTSHRQNLLSAAYHDVGVAVLDGVMDGVSTTVVVQFFGAQTSPIAIPAATAPLKPTVKAAEVAPQPSIIPVTSTATSQPAPVVTTPTEPATAPAAEPVLPTPPLVQPIPERPQLLPAVLLPATPSIQPVLSPLIFSIFGCYIALITGAAVIEKMTTPKASRHLVSLLSAYQ